jgi:cytoskeletal protein CcmA (bactofilin family)
MSFLSTRKQQSTRDSGDFPQTPSTLASHHSAGFETVLGSSATLKGDLRSQANVRLDGIFEGTLEIDGNVLVGETAKITADINAKNVSIAGAVRGNVSGKKVQLLRTARVWGDISATAISTEEGAFIEGKITMISHEATQAFDLSSVPLPDEPAIEDVSPGDEEAEPSSSPDESEASQP